MILNIEASPVAPNGQTTFFGQAPFSTAALAAPPVPEIQQTLERLKDGFYLQ
jgi:hypothetical protein